MSELIPRKKAVPVQAHRAEPETIYVPGAGTVRPSAAMPGVTQNIIYVNVSQPAPSAPPSPGEPQPLSWSDRPKRLGKGTSFLGMFAFVLGAAASGMAYLPPPILPLAKPVAMAGGALALLGLLGAIVLNRVGRGMPILGLIASAAAYGLWLSKTGQMPKPLQDLQNHIVAKMAPAPATPAPPPSAAPLGQSQNPPSTSSPAGLPKAQAPDNGLLHDNTIFGDGNGGWVKPAGSSSATQPAAVAPSSAVPAQPPVIDVASAKANLETARLAAAKRLNVDYAGAEAAYQDADTDYKQARIADAPGSADLIATAKLRLQADSQLKTVLAKLESDPAVAAAEKALTTAQAER